MSSLRGQLLIASPELADMFRRSVVLVLEHSPDGAMGLVLNRPSEYAVDDAVPGLSGLVDPGDLVRVGGPVEPEAVLALGEFAVPAEAQQLIVGSVGLLDPERDEATLGRVRVYAGYAGWAPGQLDGEIEAGAWFVEPAEPEDPFLELDLWPAALQRKGGEYALLSRLPADPSLN